ncbi:hypothetical protein ACQ86F_23530 [Streptomyces venezuelae ATCC 10712]
MTTTSSGAVSAPKARRTGTVRVRPAGTAKPPKPVNAPTFSASSVDSKATGRQRAAPAS